MRPLNGLSLITARREKSLSDAKIARELEILQAAYNHAAKQGGIRVVPVIELPKVSNARKVFFPLERVPELLEETGRLCTHVRDFLQWLSYSGMRPKAIRLLRWSNLDARDWVLTLAAEEDKNRFGRELAIADEGREILELRPRDFSEFIFGHAAEGCTLGRGGRRLRSLTEKHILEVWRATLAEMDLPRVRKASVRTTSRKRLCGRSAALECQRSARCTSPARPHFAAPFISAA